ncbi:kinase-like domain-containing protein [Gigaspora rosea]|uniref:Kinase-like domain-containing protein n=1 Tax=Gigaspora rosea TaxID=44941 RepID=A0A397TZW0_9GLOM|nr:kinase-like domain-containing protein [Gigaspora rosea]
MSNENLTKLIDNFNQLNFISCQKLADMNEPDGIYRLGYCYEYGIGVEKDERKAFTYYQKSAEMNNSNRIYQVGYCYYLGIGVDVDKHKAFTYYLKSAEEGNSMGIWKTAICYRYGIGVEENYDEYYKWFYKNSKYGKCANCNEFNTQKAWCQTCDPDITIQRWTSGNKKIDDCMKAIQLRTYSYEGIIEWISFDRLVNIKKIGEGGFGSIFSATWLDGIREIKEIEKTDKDENDDVDVEDDDDSNFNDDNKDDDSNFNDDNKDDDNYIYMRARKPSSTIALKTLSGSKKNHDFLKEFESLAKCGLLGTKLKIYGLAQNTKANEFLMAFQYADNGSLYKFLSKNFRELTWQTKLKLLCDISNDLNNIHYAGYIHADFHSGNILQDKGISNVIQPYISDMGLSKKYNENDSKDCIYGVIPYVAPEVLSGQKFTQKADIYSFGIIMVEISTGQRPFDGYQFNEELSVKICIGLRPEFAPGTPECYVKLAKQCMDSDPQKRPNAYDIRDTLDDWYDKIKGSDNVDLANEGADNKDNKDENIIKRQFLTADKMVKELQTTLPKHPDIMYTSKIINTQKISNAIKSTYFKIILYYLFNFLLINYTILAALASKPIDSTTIPLGEYYIR